MTNGRTLALVLSVAAVPVAGAAGPAPPPSHSHAACTPAPVGPEAGEWLRRAQEALRVPAAGILDFQSVGRQVMDYQSDRSYPPFFSAMTLDEVRYDVRSGVERVQRRTVFPRVGPGERTFDTRTVADGTWMERGDSLVPLEGLHPSMARVRELNPWAVLADWQQAPSVRVDGVCLYRDFPRVVLSRTGGFGTRERLFLDPETAFPVKLDRVEPHGTWGQQDVEILWSTWIEAGAAYFPSASFRLTDGTVELERTVGALSLIAQEQDSIHVPPHPSMPPADPYFEAWTATPPDTVRVGADAFLLAHRFYNEMVVLADDTVWVLDATLSERRARQVDDWIDRLFPGHPVAVVVTDLAWPHVGGVRYWVARGAPIYTHAASETFIRELVARRWTLAPDALEAARGRARLEIVTLDAATSVAGGELRLVPIDGIGSEGALMAWMPRDRFLWAGDWIQFDDRPSLYATEVIRATQREGVVPERTAAQHLPVRAWSEIVAANERGPS